MCRIAPDSPVCRCPQRASNARHVATLAGLRLVEEMAPKQAKTVNRLRVTFLQPSTDRSATSPPEPCAQTLQPLNEVPLGSTATRFDTSPIFKYNLWRR